MGDDWHEFFKDFPDLDPANSDLSDGELRAKGLTGWDFVGATEKHEQDRTKEQGSDESREPA